MVVTELTGSGDIPLSPLRMPGTNTSNPSVTSMSLLLKELGSPSLGDTGNSLTLGDTDDINDLVLSEDVVNGDVLLKEALGEVDLLGNGSSVDLDLDDVTLLGSQVLEEIWLGVSDKSDDLAVLLDSVDLGLERLGAVVLEVLGEGGLLLAGVPVLVEPSLEGVAEGAGPDGGEGSEALRGLDVADDSDSLHRRGLDDGHGFDDFQFMEPGLRPDQISGDVGHTSLETSEGGEVAWLGGVVLRKGSDSSAMSLGSLPWEESKGSVSWLLELFVGHLKFVGEMNFIL